MVFVPYVPTPPPSRRARELADKVNDLVRLAAQGDPDLGAHEIQQALRLSEVELRGELGGFDQKKAVLVALVALLLLGLGLFLVLYLKIGPSLITSPRLWVIFGGVLLLGLVAIAMTIARR